MREQQAMKDARADYSPQRGPVIQDQMRCLLESLVEDGQGPREALNNLYLDGIHPEHLVAPALGTWLEGPSRLLAFIILADAALEPEPILEALQREGFSELAARAAMMSRRPEWARMLSKDWPFEWPAVHMQGLEVLFTGEAYRLPQGRLGGAHFVLTGGPRSNGLKAEHQLTLRGLRRPSRLGPVDTDNLQLEGCTPMPRKVQVRNLTLRDSRIRRIPSIKMLESITLDRASIRRLPEGLEARVWSVRDCPRLRRLPRNWGGSMVLLQNCRRLECIPKPTGTPLLVILHNLPRLASLGVGSSCFRLELEKCGLVILPDGLKVERDLVIRNCPRLRSLGMNTEVGGDLVMERLPAMKALPEDLVVHGRIRWEHK
jgi:hypothetical protein